ncbi:MAG: D-2-hydroxyacid dehydrogenase [Lachnospiraceae bacterium]|nr:D-2-hydroxyacid dehydrogenase [Lachnospiraceae bacterium]
MKAVLLEAGAINYNDLDFSPITSQIETTIYDNTTEENKFEHIGDAEVVFVNKVIMDEEVFSKCPDLKYIGVCATGYNVIDIEAAKRHGVVVTNVPAYSTESVTQLTWGLIIEAASHISLHNADVHNGGWVKSDTFCYILAPVMELCGKTIGVVGYGNIGRRVCEIAHAFNMNVLVHTANPDKYMGKCEENFVTLDTLFEQSDIITLHCPMNDETAGLICNDNIRKMKDKVIIVNVSRGGLVVESDLADALNSGKVGAAAVDVVSVEPMKADNPLLTAPNMTITPHMAWASLEARMRLVNVVASNYRAFAEGRADNVVNG